MLAGESAKLLVVPLVKADGQASFFPISTWAAHIMVFIAPLYRSLEGN